MSEPVTGFRGHAHIHAIEQLFARMWIRAQRWPGDSKDDADGRPRGSVEKNTAFFFKKQHPFF
jgi:hypothetical protein